jgi:dihydroxyacetone kinase
MMIEGLLGTKQTSRSAVAVAVVADAVVADAAEAEAGVEVVAVEVKAAADKEAAVAGSPAAAASACAAAGGQTFPFDRAPRRSWLGCGAAAAAGTRHHLESRTPTV